MKKKIYHKSIRIEAKKKNNKLTFLEFGWVENSTFDNDIYIMVSSVHKGGSGAWEIRTDEALLYIQGLAAVIRRKLTGVNLLLKEAKIKKSAFKNNHSQKQKILKKIENLIAEEIIIANQERQSTSRLTSLANKINKL